jgi:hypothetical protein
VRRRLRGDEIVEADITKPSDCTGMMGDWRREDPSRWVSLMLISLVRVWSHHIIRSFVRSPGLPFLAIGVGMCGKYCKGQIQDGRRQFSLIPYQLTGYAWIFTYNAIPPDIKFLEMPQFADSGR